MTYSRWSLSLLCATVFLMNETFAQPVRSQRSAGAAGSLLVAPTTADPTLKTQFDEPNLIMVPKGNPRPELVVFLPGSNGKPQGLHTLLGVIAAGGYRTIGLMYNDIGAAAGSCENGTDLACFGRMREERLAADAPNAAVQNSVEESIVGRLVRLLGYLDRTQPGQGWGEYLADGQPAWGKIIVSGHSFGSGFAAYIGKKYEVARVVCFSGPVDGIRMNTPSRHLAAWLTGASRTPSDRWFAEYNTREMQPSNLANAYATLQIPPSHTLRFDRTISGNTKPAAYHVSTVLDPGYTAQWQYLFGISDQAQQSAEVTPAPAARASLPPELPKERHPDTTADMLSYSHLCTSPKRICLASFEKALADARAFISANSTRSYVLNIPAGTFDFSDETNSRTMTAIELGGIRPTTGLFTLQGAGSARTTLITAGALGQIRGANVSHIHIEGMTLRRDSMTTTQGTVTQVKPGQVTMVILRAFRWSQKCSIASPVTATGCASMTIGRAWLRT